MGDYFFKSVDEIPSPTLRQVTTLDGLDTFLTSASPAAVLAWLAIDHRSVAWKSPSTSHGKIGCWKSYAQYPRLYDGPIPELQGKFTGMSFRVPTPTVSVVDFTAVLDREVTKDEVNAAFKKASEGELKGIMAYTEEPLVSMDLKGDDHSTIVSAMDTIVLGNMVKVISWYDNEWGYACRLADITAFVASKLRVPAGVR